MLMMGENPLTPKKIYDLDVEIWPTCIVVPKGYRIGLTVRGKDYEHPGKGIRIKSFVNEMRGMRAISAQRSR